MSVSLFLLKHGHEIVKSLGSTRCNITKRDTNTLPESQKIQIIFFIFCDLGKVKTKNNEIKTTKKIEK